MDIINNLLALKIKNRIKLINKVIQNPIGYQENLLKSHIDIAKNTLFGKKHNFEKIKSYENFIELVPIRDYNQFHPYIDLIKNQNADILWPGLIKWFAKSSGTSNNRSKFIPVTQESLENCHFQAGKDMLSIYLNNNPKSNILKGKSLMIGGSTNINKLNSYYSGDLSAIIISNLPFWVKSKQLPRIKTALLKDWEKKIEYIIQEVENKNITSISGVPSWTLIIINKLLEKRGEKYLTDIWPNLELYMHGGISFQNYKESFTKYTESKKINYLEIYNASEGFFGIQNNPEKSDLLLLVNHGVFYEFIPVQDGKEIIDNIVSIKNVKKNQTYSMVISTNAGLWRYKIGDTIRFTQLDPYKIQICGRITSFINAFGEELMVSHANEAIYYSSNKTNSIVNEYVAAPYFYNDKTGCHEWIIEFKKQPKDMKKFGLFLDEKLQKLNSDYEAKRFKDILLKPPKLRVVKTPFFYNILKEEKKIGGQNKIKRLSNDRKFIEYLIKKI